MSIIGGHSGLTVYRENGHIRRWAYGGEKANPRSLNGMRQEARMLRELSGTGVAPELIEEGNDYIIEEDLGVSRPVENLDALRRNGVRLLWTLQQHRISHGDPWLKNLVIRDDRPMLVDFKLSRFFDEPMSDHRETSDQYHFWLNLAKVPSRTQPPDASGIIRQWLDVVMALGGTTPVNPLEGLSLLDLGCKQGDFCAMAAAAGMSAHGVDLDEEAIAKARILWANMPVTFSKPSALDCTRYDAVLLKGKMIWNRDEGW